MRMFHVKHKHTAGRQAASGGEIPSVFPYDGLDPAKNLRLAAVNGRIGGIFRHQPDLAVLALQPLDRGLVAQQRDDDLAVVRRLLGMDDDLVAVKDSGVDHRVPAHAKGEAFAVVAPGEIPLDILLRKNGQPGRHDADNGHPLLLRQGDGAVFAAVDADQTGLVQLGQMIMYGGRGFQANRLHDFAHGGRVTLLRGKVLQELQNLTAFGACPAHTKRSFPVMLSV